MIFLSYNHKDSGILNDIATRFASVFGQNRVFYDKWSIIPGDGIIDKMNEGLSNAEFFFFFMSSNSLSSEMVELEWQNALMLKAHKKIKFIPVKLDDCNVPTILLQNLYINLYGVGLEVAISQMIDVVNGTSQKLDTQGYQNVRCVAVFSDDRKELELTINAETYFEPVAKFLILINNAKGKVEKNVKSDSVHISNYYENMPLSNGEKKNAFYLSVDRGLAKGFPFRVIFTSEEEIDFYGCLRAVAEQDFRSIPVKIK